MIEGSLAPDDPDTGAVGRYEGLPVYVLPNIPDGLKAMGTKIGEHRGIKYGYMEMLVMD
jgi:hypothetical protein